MYHSDFTVVRRMLVKAGLGHGPMAAPNARCHGGGLLDEGVIPLRIFIIVVVVPLRTGLPHLCSPPVSFRARLADRRTGSEPRGLCPSLLGTFSVSSPFRIRGSTAIWRAGDLCVHDYHHPHPQDCAWWFGLWGRQNAVDGRDPRGLADASCSGPPPSPPSSRVSAAPRWPQAKVSHPIPHVTSELLEDVSKQKRREVPYVDLSK